MLLPFLNFSPWTHILAHSSLLFLLPRPNTSFAPCSSIITDVEFHFCSNGLQHILKSGLSTLLTAATTDRRGLSFLCAAQPQSICQEVFLTTSRYTKFSGKDSGWSLGKKRCCLLIYFSFSCLW